MSSIYLQNDNLTNALLQYKTYPICGAKTHKPYLELIESIFRIVLVNIYDMNL